MWSLWRPFARAAGVTPAGVVSSDSPETITALSGDHRLVDNLMPGTPVLPLGGNPLEQPSPDLLRAGHFSAQGLAVEAAEEPVKVWI